MTTAKHLAAQLVAKLTNKPISEFDPDKKVMSPLQQYELRGNNAVLRQLSNVPELVLVGAAGTGKTLAVLDYLHEMCVIYPKARILIMRKVRADLADSVLVTYERDILGEDNPICANIQREYRKLYRYPNGSTITIGGMDRPGKVLSAEYDIIYVPECVQLSEQDWEMLIMRNRSTVLPFQQVIGDTNPDRPDHWLKKRADAGIVTMLNTYHEDNPKYWDIDKQQWTLAGESYVLGKLNRLTGVRRARYKDGKWVIAEGAIYDEWRDDLHVVSEFNIPLHWRKIRVVDFGFTHAFVCQWWAIDDDGRMYLYREIYKTRRLVSDHAREIIRLSENERIEATICDHDAEGRAQLESAGIPTIAARKSVKTGLEAVKLRMRVEEDGKPRLFLLSDSLIERDFELEDAKLPLCTRDEIPGYIWANTKREEPVKENDHGCDAMRYAAMYLDDRETSTIATARAVGFRGRSRNRR